MEKIGRDAFIYLEAPAGHDDKDFAQCGPCRMFVPKVDGRKGGRCIIHGSFVEVDEDDSCAFMVPWPTPDGKPNPKVVADHAVELKKGITGSVTAIQSGLVSRRVQCHRCRFVDRAHSTCDLYKKLNAQMPSVFALDPNIKAHGCCNAQMPKRKKTSLYDAMDR
jgi:hypothetical protein